MSLSSAARPRRGRRATRTVTAMALTLLTSAGLASAGLGVAGSGDRALAASIIFSRVQTPGADSAVPVGLPLIVAGTSSNGEGNTVDAVDVSVDGGSSWLSANAGDNGFWSMVYTPTEPGELVLLSRASLGNVTQDQLAEPVHVTVGSTAPPPPRSCPCPLNLPTVFGSPRVADPDTSAVEVGVRFQLDRDGFITGLRIRRDPYTDPVSGHLWAPDQALLASTAEVSTPSFGPTDLVFPAPVAVQAGQTYIASYFTAAGHYDSAELYFGGALVDPPFTTVFDEFGGGGVYQYSDQPAVPIHLWNRSNYWVAPIFTS